MSKQRKREIPGAASRLQARVDGGPLGGAVKKAEHPSVKQVKTFILGSLREAERDHRERTEGLPKQEDRRFENILAHLNHPQFGLLWVHLCKRVSDWFPGIDISSLEVHLYFAFAKMSDLIGHIARPIIHENPVL